METIPCDAPTASLEALLLRLDLRVEVWLRQRGIAGRIVEERVATHRATAGQPANPAAHGAFLRAGHAWALSPWELDVLLVAIATETDPAYGRIWAQVDGTPRPSVGSVLEIFGVRGKDRSPALAALEPGGALLENALVILDGAGPLVSRRIGLEDGVWARLLGGSGAFTIDAEPGLLDALHLDPAERQAAHRAAELLRRPGDPPLLFVVAPEGSGREALARAVAGCVGMPLLPVGGKELAANDPTVAQVCRDARWHGAAVLLTEGDPDAALSSRLSVPVFWVATERDRLPVDVGRHRPTATLRLGRPDAARRAAVWRRLAGAEVEPEAIARRFRFGPGRIEEAVRRARCVGPVDRPVLERTCRELQVARFGSLAQRLRCEQTWDDLVVPEAVLEELRLALAWLRHGEQVFGTWELGRRMGASGLACLFCGPPGTGKTLAARVVARALEVDLYRVDLSQTVNKYIGETEKNLARLFDEAPEANAVLFFDEADAVFGKRTQVKDAHDRYANVETGFLLQRIEEHEGAVILASNLPQNLDDAFMRRLHVVARFEMPDRAARARIWELHLPPEAYREPDLDLDLLAGRFEISGGDIRNACLTAALRAASEGTGVGMRHLVRGLHRELRKSGRMVDIAAFGRWAGALGG